MNEAIENKSNIELYRALLAEAAKSQNEIKCAQRDIDKAALRVSFILLITNALIDRDLKGD